MIMEDYVSFETAKLLKERGFDESCTHVYNIENGRNLEADFYTCRYVYNSWLDKNEPRLITAPTLQMAMKWLREVHNMHVDVDPSEGDWASCVLELEDWSSISDGLPAGNSYEEACEIGIKYALENLI